MLILKIGEFGNMKVSIITVNFNNKKGLERTIDSVINQTYQDFEYLIIDGGSTDGSFRLIESIADKLSYWCSEHDNGIYNAMNKGIQKATGEYICFMNSGDCFASNTILEDIFSQEQTADILYGDVWRTKNGEKISIREFPKQITAEQMFRGGITHQAIFSRRQLHIENPYDESYKMIADWHFLVHRLVDGCTFAHVGKVVCLFDITGYSCSTRSPNDIHEQQFFKVLNELFPPYVQKDIQVLIRLKSPDFNGIIEQTKKMGAKGRLISKFAKIISKLPVLK